MNNAEIQIQFSTRGKWDEFTLTAIYPDKDGYTRTDRYTAREIPAEQVPAMQAVVAALVGMGEDWQACQVWARLDAVDYDDDLDPVPTVIECVVLTVEAVNEMGGRRIFTFAEYEDFFIMDPAAVAFFKYFTRP
ncbi:MAG: hypothetical protein KHX31_06685 [Akkermansia sp.]|uniref:hypothetical protein n=1 Tax=Akkermansia sp. TaxID=1872421 RepID=UPI0025C5F875|nr:hypothetical protein [Akkermansia sp.]MBS5508304.1 hypothetical protein [Akkermansia sp.]